MWALSVTVLGRVETVAGLLPMAPAPVPAGFPSPAQDYFDGEVSLDQVLIRDRAATFFLRVAGESMEGAGISDGDVVVAVLDGELTLKRLAITGRGVMLQADNPAFPSFPVSVESDFLIWGVATVCLHQLGHQMVLRHAG